MNKIKRSKIIKKDVSGHIMELNKVWNWIDVFAFEYKKTEHQEAFHKIQNLLIMAKEDAWEHDLCCVMGCYNELHDDSNMYCEKHKDDLY